MKIGLIDVDSKMPNLALMKLSAYYKKEGCQTELSYPLFVQNYDKVFASKIFTYTDEMLKKAGINKSMWYVLVGFNSTLNEDLYRLKLLRKNKQDAFVQRYNFDPAPEYIPIARWANQHHIFYHYTLENWINHPNNRRYKKLFD